MGIEVDIWWLVMLPLPKPALAVTIIFSFQANWNDFVHPLTYFIHGKLRALALGLYAFWAIPDQLWMCYLLMAASLIRVLY